MRWLTLIALVLVVAAPASAASITGQYLEARTCEVFTGPCFSNADTGLVGRHGLMAWRIDKGSLDNVSLDGLTVVAVVAGSDTLGLRQTGEGKAILIVDKKANDAQKAALIRLAKQQGGDLVKNVISVQSAAIVMESCECKEGGCARLDAGIAKVETRCINDKHDKTCGNEWALYPPLAKNVKDARAAVALEHTFTGKGFNETWKDGERRGAYLGTFDVR
ncbi:MAG: DUF1326 domain-containing protein [Gemmataceae bacterium]|nr:DUF1326 domain-containing protein [Gemmataceae bacterium]